MARLFALFRRRALVIRFRCAPEQLYGRKVLAYVRRRELECLAFLLRSDLDTPFHPLALVFDPLAQGC